MSDLYSISSCLFDIRLSGLISLFVLSHCVNHERTTGIGRLRRQDEVNVWMRKCYNWIEAHVSLRIFTENSTFLNIVQSCCDTMLCLLCLMMDCSAEEPVSACLFLSLYILIEAFSFQQMAWLVKFLLHLCFLRMYYNGINFFYLI